MVKKCAMQQTTLMIKQESVLYDHRFDTNDEILIVKWLDNK